MTRLVCLALLAALACASPVTAASTCADRVLDDWLDNSRIDGLYALPCYEEAIAAIPTDIRDYSNAEEVISRALQDAARDSGAATPLPTTPPTEPTTPPATTVTPAVSTSTGAVPVPLLVLGGMCLVLLAAGAGAFGLRRRRERDAGP